MKRSVALHALIIAAACGGGDTRGVADVDRSFRCRTALDVPASCAACLEASCCDETIACGEDFACKACVQPGHQTECSATTPAAAAVIACKKDRCADVCPPPFVDVLADAACSLPPTPPSGGSCAVVGNPGVDCNPVTNEGCMGEEACDGFAGRFTCLPTGNVNALCAPCGYGSYDFCVGGHHCVGHCGRFCCSDADCGDGRCDDGVVANMFFGKPPDTPGLGICVETP